MSFLKYAVPALAVARTAFAQCSVSATQTISAATDASALAGCATFTGSLAIATGTTDNIALNGITVLNGNLVANNVSLITTLTSTTLQSITGIMDLEQDQVLTTLSFPSLTHVNQLRWVALPALYGFTFTAAVQTASSVYIQDTQISSIDGINLVQVDQFSLISNHFLEDVTMHLTNATSNITLSDNGGHIAVNLPNLIWAGSLSIANVSTFLTPSLAVVNESMTLLGNEFQNYSAPNLTSVGSARAGGDLVLIDNSALNNISFPSLTSIGGGLTLAKNPYLTVLDGFPNLQTIAGAVDLNGNFSGIVALPALTNVAGAFNLQGPNVSAACTTFGAEHGRNNVIKGSFTCASTNAPQGAGSTPSNTTSGSSSSSSHSAASANLNVQSGALVGLFGVLAAAFGLL